jgi:7-cyano-7-deazaguanine synthase
MTQSASADNQSTIGLLASGGLDSCILLSRLIEQGRMVRPFYVRSGLAWQDDELRYLKRYLHRVASERVLDLVLFELPLTDLYGPHWSVTGDGVPDQDSADDAVFLPGRNLLLCAKPAVWCQLHGVGELALATLGGNPFSDASDEFFAAYQNTLNRGAAAEIEIIRPFAKLQKREVMQLARSYPLEDTFSCIAPTRGLHCGRCNKCAERKAAFLSAEMRDPTVYAP